jgi:hypothetical protein
MGILSGFPRNGFPERCSLAARIQDKQEDVNTGSHGEMSELHTKLLALPFVEHARAV